MRKTKTVKCQSCPRTIERRARLVDSKKVSFTCKSCHDQYHRQYSSRAYYQKKAWREAVRSIRGAEEITWGQKKGLVATKPSGN